MSDRPFVAPQRVVWLVGGWAAAVVAAGLIRVELGLALVVAGVLTVVCARSRRDAAALLTLFVICLAIPANQVLPGIGSSGRPAVIVGLVGLLLMAFAASVPAIELPGGPNPLRVATFWYAAAVLVSYVAAFGRPMLPVEVSGADRGLIVLAGMVGVTLLAADGIENDERLDALLRRLVVFTAILAAVGIVQFFTAIDLAARIHVPGLVPTDQALAVETRGDFRRVAAMTLHPIEFGVVMCTVLPIALHYALFDNGRIAWRRWAPVALIGLAIPLSLSRTSLLGTAIVLAVLLPTWPRSLRLNALAVMAAGLAAMRAAIPGLVGTLIGLFVHFNEDTSVQARTDRYGLAAEFIRERPIFGRGFYTWVPDRYQILDNEYLVTLITTGFVGLVALVTLFVVGASVARGARRRSSDPRVRHLGQSLAAAIAAFLVIFATYDALSFPTATGVLFLLLGCAGALWRLHRRPQEAHPWHPAYRELSRLGRQ